ncbi:hypothetical protein ASF59_15500 [Methylobacterium sp. Leaf121]|nr:hypothetical protein ASF59_15500 [Methylobacterium sp. Leaf121]
MPRWLFETLCVLAFAAPIGAACLHAWPFITTRPLPTGLESEMALLAALTLLLSAGLIMLMSVRLQSRR